MPTITKSQIIYNEQDFLAGLHPQYGSRTIPQKLGKYASQEYNFNAYSDLGYAKNGFLNTDFTNAASIKSRIIKTIGGSDNFFYGIDSGKYFYKLSNLGGTSPALELGGGVFPYSIHATAVCSDVIEHYLGNAKTKVIWYSYNNGTNGDVGGYGLVAGTFDPDYMSSVPVGAAALANAYPHPLCVGHDDVLYIGNGRSLYMYDYSDTAGANGKLTQDVLLLPEDYVITSIIKLQPRTLVIFAKRGLYGVGGSAKAFFWDYLSSDPYQIEDLYDYNVLTPFDYKGTIGCVTEGLETARKVKIFDGSEFTILTKFTQSTSEDGPCIGGVDVNDNEIWIHTADANKGYIYRYGNNEGLPNKLDLVAKSITGAAATYAGYIKLAATNGVTFSTGKDDGTGSYIQFLDKTKYATDGYWYSDLIDIGNERVRITDITIYFADEFTGGRTITLDLFDRHTSYTIQGISALGTVTTTNRVFRAKPFNNTGGTAIPPLDGVGIKLTWATGAGSGVTPIINKVVLDYVITPIN